MEIWKDIKGYKGLYQVSNYGRVKSLDRYVNNRYSGYFRKGKILSINYIKTTPNYTRPSVLLSKKCKKYSKVISRLVVETFIGNIKNKEIHHKDHNPQNNNINNLKILDSKTHKKETKINNNLFHKYKNTQVEVIKKAFKK